MYTCSLIYSAPTSGGKTLVAEILMLQRLAASQDRNGVIFFVVPFVALVEEKVILTLLYTVWGPLNLTTRAHLQASYLRSMWQDMNIAIKIFHSEDGGGVEDELPHDTDICICTIEKANMLLNCLLDGHDEDRSNVKTEEKGSKSASRLRMIVIDEFHMITDTSRGFILEVLVSKILYLLGDQVQIVGMSATMPNVSDLSKWIGASLYCTTFRPVNLNLLVCFDKALYRVTSLEANDAKDLKPNASEVPPSLSKAYFTSVEDKTVCFEFKEKVPDLKGLSKEHDIDGFIRLCLDSVANRHSVLLFCPSKDRCERCCDLLVAALREESSLVKSSFLDAEGAEKMYQLRQGRQRVLEDLQNTCVGLAARLLESVSRGVAYHHAGLISDERMILEQAFRDGYLSILCTTSTLSAGVNLYVLL